MGFEIPVGYIDAPAGMEHDVTLVSSGLNPAVFR